MKKTIRSIRVLCIFAWTLLSLPVLAQPIGHELDGLFSYYTENARFSGVVMAAENGRIIYKKAFGFADFEAKIPMDTTAVFNIASATKPFTAMAILMLREMGQLELDDNMMKFLPDFPDYGSAITIRQLLTHTSGIRDYANELRLQNEVPVLTAGLVYDSLIAQKGLNFSPGEKYSYSNSGYFLLALVIEKISGQSYREFLLENIFEPLGMDHTLALDESHLEIPGRTNGYVGFWMKNEDDLNCRVPGDGNIYSTVSDLFLFDQALSGHTLVNEKTINEAFDTTNLLRIRDNGLKYGYGWHVLHESAGLTVYHPGGQGGFRCQYWRNLDKRRTLIVLSNNTCLQTNPGLLSAAQKIMKEEDYSMGRISVAELFYKYLPSDGFDTALVKMKQAKENNDMKYIFPELEINNLGLDYMFFKREPHHAVALFKFNAEAHPTSWNAYDSLGEGYLQIGEDELSAAAFEKSLELNPDNSNAANQLKKIRMKGEK